MELAGVVVRVCETTFAFKIDELDQLSEVDGRDRLDGGKFLQDRSAGRPEDVLERFLVVMGIFTGFEIDDGQGISRLLSPLPIFPC